LRHVEKALENLARHKQIDLPSARRGWIVQVANENLPPKFCRRGCDDLPYATANPL
jgi:hypothetical protein